MVNRAPWYKQLKSIIPTNIPNQKARPRIKKMSINYKSQKKDFAFFHCSPPQKKRQVPEKRLCIFSLFPPKKRQVPGKKICTIFRFFSKKKDKSQEKKLALFFVFSPKKRQVPEKLTQFRSSEQPILHSSSFSFFFFFFFFFLQIEAPKSLVRTELNPPTNLPYISNLHTLQPSPLTPHSCNTCPNRNFPHSIINMMQQQKHK